MATLEEMLADADSAPEFVYAAQEPPEPFKALHRCPSHVRELAAEVGRLTEERNRIATRAAELERGLDLSSGRFAALRRAAADAWRRLADDLENPSLQARAEALQWAGDVMLGSAAGLGDPGGEGGEK